MAITLGKIKNMRLRNKLAFIYTVFFTTILGFSFLFIYLFSERNREETFIKRLSERMMTSFKLLVEIRRIDANLIDVLDINAANNLKDKHVFLFDANSRLVYSNVDEAKAGPYLYILKSLKTDDSTFDATEGKYELLGLRFTDKNQTYYGIVKAYDRFGKGKVHFLALSLICTFAVAIALVIILSFFLSRTITRPITMLANDVQKISPDDLSMRVYSITTDDEIALLSKKFNELLDKVENAFKFQYHYINHLSHELKTPLAIMMANAERSLAENENEKLRASMQFQKASIMELSNIINAMLDISKMEKKLSVLTAESIRIDEIIFECMDEITYLNSNVSFDFNINNAADESDLIISGNSRMIKMTIMNLIRNAVNFSTDSRPSIEITASAYAVNIAITNDGDILNPQERLKLFKHSFRGSNSTSVKGFGLGLVLSHRIVNMHKGSLDYSVVDGNRNCFLLSLPHQMA